jgi:maltooligosyltrehalose trehalohydrolase
MQLNHKIDQLCEQTRKRFHLIAETGFNVPKVLMPEGQGGLNFDGQWLDDFQHAVFALLTGEREGYYRNYGSIKEVTEVLQDAYVYVGDQSSFRRRKPDEYFCEIPADRFVVFSQNHDQIGNRILGERLTTLVGDEGAKLAAGTVLLSPYVPLLFMGEEYGETAPFLFFTDYQGQSLIDGIREGRRKEFASFHWKGDAPEPQSEETFLKSKLNWRQRYEGRCKKITSYYSALIALRKKPLFHPQVKRQIKEVFSLNDKVLFIHKEDSREDAAVIANFASQPSSYEFPFGGGTYVKVLDSVDVAYDGPGATLPSATQKGEKHAVGGFNFAVYIKDKNKEGNSLE